MAKDDVVADQPRPRFPTLTPTMRPDDHSRVPPLVRRYLERTLLEESTAPRHVRLTQVGQLRLKPGSRWLPFTADQQTFVHEVSFFWRARVRLLPLASIVVLDRYVDGHGIGEARLFGVRISRDSGGHVAEGAALRYLAELPWNPFAMRTNRHLAWRELDGQTVEVATEVGPGRPALQLHFDATGDIVKAWTDARPRKERDEIVRRPWGGSFAGYELVGGIRIPTRAEVTWELPDGVFAWFRGAITSLQTSC